MMTVTITMTMGEDYPYLAVFCCPTKLQLVHCSLLHAGFKYIGL